MGAKIKPDKSKVGVIGYPVGHSLSPLIHNHWIRAYGFNAQYEAVEILPEKLEPSVRHMLDQGFIGFNVTIPHKQAIMTLCDTLDEAAQIIGAVNTVCVRADGSLHGMNTDAFGFVENLRQSHPAVDLADGKALVLGAGGAARAIVQGLREMGVKDIVLSNRTRGKAEEIAADFPVSVVPWTQREAAAEVANILVNTTSLGMTGQPDLEFDLAALPPASVVYDIVYKPLYTPLLQQAQRRGNVIVTGIGMLLHQARPAFKEWFGVMPAVDDKLQQKVLESAQ